MGGKDRQPRLTHAATDTDKQLLTSKKHQVTRHLRQ